MSTTKAPKGKIVFREDTMDADERQKRREELMGKYPSGCVWIQPICDYKALVSDSAPRPEDHWIPRISHIKVPISTSRGMHPMTGLPRYEDRQFTIDLVDKDLKWPVDVRTDAIKGLGPNVIDPWELLDFLDSFPARHNLFRMLPIDPIIDKRIKAGMKDKGAKSALHDVIAGKNAANRPSQSIPDTRTPKRSKEGKSFDEGMEETVDATAFATED